ncbi:glycosyltransferase family 2 protein [Sulfurimonas sp. SWIR-19]|uniref:glycosyltransferase family 2 protein n=1 Tax=Sulfurimonas sp. SWIR-19 TaxID=2878390 RepID=UPI001CF1A514|nr:glycosyltransferase family 2 protein [Sulfurimonas sp. SWIR-19]UCN01133.1 glycosyltransferase family 2 protein [Sulfurimonas sp. SWIR-19]
MMSSQKPLVTVMVPTYNQETYIHRTISSILEQSYENIEIIVSDDSPHTRTGEIIHECFYDKNIKYIHNEKAKGRVANYHFILYEMATGEWIVNLDGDDYFEDRDFIKKAVNIVTIYPEVVMVVGQQKIYNEATQSFYCPPKIIKNDYEIVSGDQLFLNSIFKNIEIPHLASLYHRQKAIKKEFYEMDIISSDRASLLKLMLNEKAALLNSYAGVWVHHKKNISQNMDCKDVFTNITLYDHIFLYAKEFRKIPYWLLYSWKVLGQYKNIYGYIIECIEKRNKKIFPFFKKLVYMYPLLAFLLLIDIRIYRKIIEREND